MRPLRRAAVVVIVLAASILLLATLAAGPRPGSRGSSSTRSSRPPTAASPSATPGLRADHRPRLRRARPAGPPQRDHQRPRPGPAQRPRHGRVRRDVHALEAGGPCEGERRPHLRACRTGATGSSSPPSTSGGDPGDGFFFNRGDIILYSGWQGDVVARPGAETITVPVAKNRDGSSITGPVLARFSDMPAGDADALAPLGARAGRPRHEPGHPHPAGLRGRGRHPDRPRRLGVRRLPHGPVPRHARPDPHFAQGRASTPPTCTSWSTPRRTRRCSASGLAATRDIVSFFRHADTGRQRHGQPDPGEGVPRRRPGHLAGRQLRQDVPPPRIQRGRVRPDRLGRGERPHRRPPAADQLPLRPARRRRRHVRAGQRGRAVVGRLRGRGPRPQVGRPARPLPRLGHRARRCSRRSARPSSGACGCRRTWWGPPADRDIPLPPNVRRYYFPGTTHGGGRGGFGTAASGPRTATNCRTTPTRSRRRCGH